MSVEQKLQNYILENYKSIMQFAKVAELPYTTVKGIFNRGIWGTSIQNVIKICNTLSIDINALINGEIKKDIHIHELTSHEKKLVVAYRNKPEMQPAIDKLLNINDDSSEEYVTVLTAARSSDNRPIEFQKISKEKLELLKNAKSVEDESDL